MIETSITGIDAEKIKNELNRQLQYTSFQEDPQSITSDYSADISEPVEHVPLGDRTIYGLSFYLKQLRSSCYRKNAFREFKESSQYRSLFFFLVKRALFNKIKMIFKACSRFSRKGI